MRLGAATLTSVVLPTHLREHSKGRPKGRPFSLWYGANRSLGAQGGTAMLRITDQIVVQDWELTELFTRSQGPGGQNVNKVATAVELRFAAAMSPSLPEAVKARLKRLAGRRWTDAGELVLRVEATRSQARNREIARERLADLIRRALVAPRRRIATKPTAGSQRRRLASKTRRGELKTLRGKVTPEE